MVIDGVFLFLVLEKNEKRLEWLDNSDHSQERVNMIGFRFVGLVYETVSKLGNLRDIVQHDTLQRDTTIDKFVDIGFLPHRQNHMMFQQMSSIGQCMKILFVASSLVVYSCCIRCCSDVVFHSFTQKVNDVVLDDQQYYESFLVE